MKFSNVTKCVLLCLLAGLNVLLCSYEPPIGPDGKAIPPQHIDNFTFMGYEVFQLRGDVRQRTNTLHLDRYDMTLMSMAYSSDEMVERFFAPIVFGKWSPEEVEKVFIPALYQRPDGLTIIAWMPVFKDTKRNVELYLAAYDAQGKLTDACYGGSPKEFDFLLESRPDGPHMQFEQVNYLEAFLNGDSICIQSANFAYVTSERKTRKLYVLDARFRNAYEVDSQGHFVNAQMADSLATGEYDPLARRILSTVFSPKSAGPIFDEWSNLATEAKIAGASDNECVSKDYDQFLNYNKRLWDSNPAAYIDWLANHKDNAALADVLKESMRRELIGADDVRNLVDQQSKKAKKALQKALAL